MKMSKFEKLVRNGPLMLVTDFEDKICLRQVSKEECHQHPSSTTMFLSLPGSVV